MFKDLDLLKEIIKSNGWKFEKASGCVEDLPAIYIKVWVTGKKRRQWVYLSIFNTTLVMCRVRKYRRKHSRGLGRIVMRFPLSDPLSLDKTKLFVEQHEED